MYFLYVISNGADDLFDVENKAGKKFIGTGRCSKKISDLEEGGPWGADLKCNGGKFFLLFIIWSFSSLKTACRKKLLIRISSKLGRRIMERWGFFLATHA